MANQGLDQFMWWLCWISLAQWVASSAGKTRAVCPGWTCQERLSRCSIKNWSRMISSPLWLSRMTLRLWSQANTSPTSNKMPCSPWSTGRFGWAVLLWRLVSRKPSITSKTSTIPRTEARLRSVLWCWLMSATIAWQTRTTSLRCFRTHQSTAPLSESHKSSGLKPVRSLSRSRALTISVRLRTQTFRNISLTTSTIRSSLLPIT